MFLVALENVGILLLMAVPGFIITKIKLLKNPTGAVDFISILLLYVCQPFICANSFLNTDFDIRIVWNMVAVFFFTVVIMTVMSFIGKLVTLKLKDADSKIMVPFAGGFGNLGFMAIPFLQILLPGNSEVILYATCSVVAFNLMAWTLGCYILTGDKKYIRLKQAVLNPPTLAFLLMLPLFIFNLNFNASPSLAGLKNMCSLFANLVGPLSMTLLGIKFAEMNLKELFLDYRPYLGALLKLIVSPIIAICFLFIMRTFMDISSIQINLVCIGAMPCANNIMMFASIYKKDVKLSAKIVALSTTLSVITIPLFLMLAEAVVFI